jgi:hypothetical protein
LLIVIDTAGTIDLAHAAGADQFLDLVRAEALACARGN